MTSNQGTHRTIGEIETNIVAYPKPTISFDEFGADGNACALMGVVTRHLKKAGRAHGLSHQIISDRVEEFHIEAMSGDYDNLLQVCMRYADIA